ncbi:uncharacterized protein PAC_11896 [Phialocephala subalpina]|uniref:Oxidoreductase acuF-like C2H2 type zinc-finger domain-containing protein n=1 Tax=Phialocephala subalpina TaxID=576137 RepID=A0A1L7XAF4_9HELO|nr:uncharacterized protein PAC_11896 [Phialocephala subalpina]
MKQSESTACSSSWLRLFDRAIPTTGFGISESEVSDTLGRYRIWAGNIGAFQHSELKISLSFRICDAPKIAARIAELLGDIAESLDDAYQIVSNTRENRTAPLSSEAEGDSDSEEEMSEIREIFDSIDDAVKNLFRLSIIIRNSTNRDRYSRAASSAMTSPFNEQFDINHVRHKFPALEKSNKLWLIQRLGRSITQRRHYLRYCREHHAKIARDVSADEQPKTHDEPQPMMTGLGSGAKSQKSKPTSTLAPTQASTLVITLSQSLDEEVVEDNQSQTSYAASTEEESGSGKLSVVALEGVSGQEKHFECPYCWQIQAISSQKSWKKYVFSDLNLYVRTFENCDLKMFSDRHTWLAHEVGHRHQWCCYFCTSNRTFTKPEEYRHHLERCHPQAFVSPQLSTLLELSRRPITKMSPCDYPFCKIWEERLRAINPHIPPLECLIVTPSQFQHHVGGHMEQLALFAVPRGSTEEGDTGSANAAPQVGSDCSSLGLSLPDSRVAVELRFCEDIFDVMTSVPSAEKYMSSLPPVTVRLPETRRISRTPPTSLSFISQKLQKGAYIDARDFQLDVILMFAPSFAENPHVKDKLLQNVVDLFLDFCSDKSNGNGGNRWIEQGRTSTGSFRYLRSQVPSKAARLGQQSRHEKVLAAIKLRATLCLCGMLRHDSCNLTPFRKSPEAERLRP